MDLVFVKFSPGTFDCVASCCTATPTTGQCGLLQITNSLTSNGVEEAYLLDAEVYFPGTRYSYLVYVMIPPPQNPANLKRTNAQVRFWSSASTRNPVISYNMYASPEQLADSQFTPTYWVVFCLAYSGGVYSFTNLTGATSAFSFTVPLPSDYCP